MFRVSFEIATNFTHILDEAGLLIQRNVFRVHLPKNFHQIAVALGMEFRKMARCLRFNRGKHFAHHFRIGNATLQCPSCAVGKQDRRRATYDRLHEVDFVFNGWIRSTVVGLHQF